jgi:flagellar motility protein MotE (MotC chaperone)
MMIGPPRLLPATIVAVTVLLGVKTLELVRAATPAGALGGTVAAPVATAATVQVVPPTQPPTTPPISDSEKALLQQLRQRNQQLDAREKAVAARESILAAAEEKLNQRVAELQVLQQKLEAMDAARKQRQDASWQGLVKLYADMKPRQAAQIFDDLDMPVLLEVVDRMDERKAAAILAAMQPERARDITARLAQMRIKRDSGG